MLKLNEEMFEDIEVIGVPEVEVPAVAVDPIPVVETEPEGPEVGPDMGMSNLLMQLIQEEYEAIKSYNAGVATAEENGYGEIASTLKSIANEEMLHVGELEAALRLVSPNVDNIETGKEEATEIVANSDDNIEGLEKYLLGEEVESNSDETIIEEDLEDAEITDEALNIKAGPLEFNANTIDNAVNTVGDVVNNTVDKALENPEGTTALAGAAANIIPLLADDEGEKEDDDDDIIVEDTTVNADGTLDWSGCADLLKETLEADENKVEEAL